MKQTPQILAGAGAVLLALLLGAGSILGGFGSYPVDESATMTLQVDARARGVVPAAAAEEPVVASAAGERRINPFNLKAEHTLRKVSVPLPPPPSLRSPEPVVLPLRPVAVETP